MLILGIFSVAGLGAMAYIYFSNSAVDRLTLAAGGSTGDSYVISQALKTVVERHYPKIKVKVIETGGTSENLQLLEDGKVHLATAQADVPAGDSARSIAVLFRDNFQLAVHSGSGIKSFAELKGKRIALPQKGGQAKSFLAVALHFGMKASDFHFVGKDDHSSDAAFERGEADAVFRVRALSNNAILHLAHTKGVEFLQIDQASAMQIRIPAYMPTVIPQGAYSGSPSIPARDLPTIAVERTLLTRKDVDDDLVRAITTVLVEYRHEVALAIPDNMAEMRPLLAGVQQPNTTSGLSIAVHPGAKAYYDRDVPSFYQQYADYVGLWVTAFLLFGSWIWEGKRWLEKRQKNLADKYNHDIIELIDRAHGSESEGDLEKIRAEMLTVLMNAVRDLDSGKIANEAFRSFRDIWQIALDAVRERNLMLQEAPLKAESAMQRAAT